MPFHPNDQLASWKRLEKLGNKPCAWTNPCRSEQGDFERLGAQCIVSLPGDGSKGAKKAISRRFTCVLERDDLLIMMRSESLVVRYASMCVQIRQSMGCKLLDGEDEVDSIILHEPIPPAVCSWLAGAQSFSVCRIKVRRPGDSPVLVKVVVTVKFTEECAASTASGAKRVEKDLSSIQLAPGVLRADVANLV